MSSRCMSSSACRAAPPLRAWTLATCILVSVAWGSAVAAGPWHANEENTRGWQLMSPEERIEHQARIRGFTRYEDCLAYRTEHHRLMVERAASAGLQLRQGGRDFCEHLRPPSGLQK